MFRRQKANHLGFWQNQRGSVAVTIGVIMVALLGMVGLGSEIVLLLLKHRQMQMAADAAAVSASTALAKGFPSDLSIEARAIAAEIGFVNGVNGVTVTVNHPPTSGSNSGNSYAVQVTVAQPQTLYLVSLFRSGIFDVGATAVGLVPQSWQYCMLALNPSASGALTIKNNSSLPNSTCGVAVNSSSGTALLVNNNASINGPVSVTGNWSLSNGAQLNSPSLQHNAPVIPDPYANVPLLAAPACTGQSGSGGNGVNVSLLPGHFCAGFNFGNTATVNLAPGVYYIDQQITLGNNTTINGTGGVTIVVNGNYAVNFTNNAHINITAPATGNYAGMAFFGPRASSPAVTQTFANLGIYNIKGVVYFPSQTVEFDNNGATSSGGCTQVIASIIAVQNNVSLNNNCAGTGVQPLGSGASYLVE